MEEEIVLVFGHVERIKLWSLSQVLSCPEKILRSWLILNIIYFVIKSIENSMLNSARAGIFVGMECGHIEMKNSPQPREVHIRFTNITTYVKMTSELYLN